jgi:hypothetical protein
LRSDGFGKAAIDDRNRGFVNLPESMERIEQGNGIPIGVIPGPDGV